jgi:hypothetical protein
LTISSADAFWRLLILSFVTSDGAADAVLPAVQPALLGLSQVAVVFGHIRFLAVLQSGFAGFQTGRLPWLKRAIFHPIGDTPLLTGFPPIDLIHAWMTRIYDASAGA